MTTTAPEKLRNIVNWLDYQTEYFNERLRTISDVEKVYDYTIENNINFLDDLSWMSDVEYKKTVKEISELLGYSIF